MDNEVLPPYAPPRRSGEGVPIVIRTEPAESDVHEVVITGLDIGWNDISWFAFKFLLAMLASAFLIYVGGMALYYGVGMLFLAGRS